MVVIEALSQGTPAVVVAGPDNAATDFITEGENGFIAASAEPEEIGAAIAKCVDGGDELRASAWQWYEEHRKELSIDDSLAKIAAKYRELSRE
jgi:glycosyltransferase involved in cell wall biosynthesis